MIDVRNLTFTYPGSSNTALRGVRFSVAEGEYVAIAGANGSGKSTLIRCLNGLLPPPEGSVLVDGLDPAHPGELARIRRSLALVFQSPPDQIVASVVEEDTAFGLENLGVPRGEMVPRVESALADVGLLGERARQTRFLSAGQQQRLAVAGALVMRPKYIVFDEATSMIDPAGRGEILGLMDAFSASGATILHVTHDMDEAARASRAIVLSEGVLVFDGAPAELFRRGDLGDLGLTPPRSWSVALDLGLEPRAGESPEELGVRLAALAPGSPEGRYASETQGSAPAREPMESAFRLEDASIRYLKGTIHERLALRAFSLEIPKGAIVALVGATGSGKSSVLQLLDALVFPDTGRALSFGLDTSNPKTDVKAVRMNAPLAVQRPESAIFEYYAGDEVSFGPRNQGLSGPALVSRVEKAMNAVGLPFREFRDRPSRSLSGGQKRRLALASVLSMDPEAILLDEPGAALDPVSRVSLMDRVLSYAREGKTVVFATHSMEEAARADLVVVLADGEMAGAGAPRRLFGPDWDDSWGLSRPFAAQVSFAAREAGAELPGDILDEEELVQALRSGRGDSVPETRP